MKIVTNFNSFKECLSAPVNDGQFDVYFRDSDTMTVCEHNNLNESKADISLYPANNINSQMAEMIMLGQKMITEGNFIYVTNNEELLAAKTYSTDPDSAVIYFEKDMESAFARNVQGKSQNKKKPAKSITSDTKKNDPAETAEESKENVKEYLPKEDMPKNEDVKAEQVIPETQKTESVKPESPKPTAKTRTVKPAALAEKDIRGSKQAPAKKEKQEVAEEPVKEVVESPKTEEADNTAFKTPPELIKKLTAIDAEFGKFPDHIVGCLKESKSEEDFKYRLNFYVEPKLINDVAGKINPFFAELKELADKTKFSVNSHYKKPKDF